MNKRTPVIFISLILALGIGYLVFWLYTGKNEEHDRRVQKETELSNKIAELGQKEVELANLMEQKKAVEEDLNKKIGEMETAIQEHEDRGKILSERVDGLTLEKETLENDVIEKEKSIADLSKKIHALEMDKLDLVNSLKQSRITAQSPSEEGVDTVRLGQITVQKDSNSIAQVEHVNNIYGFIIINAGTKQGIRKDQVVSLVRNNKIIGKAVIQKPKDYVSAAVILPEWTADTIRVGDSVSL